MGQSWGKDARVYVSDVSFADAELVMVKRAKDVTNVTEAADLTASAREYPTKIHHQGAKDFGVEFERLLTEDDEGDDDVVLLKDAYDNRTELYVLVTRAAKDQTSGEGLRFLGVVLGFPEAFPEEGPTTVRLRLMTSDETTVERVDTPYEEE